MSTIQQWTSPLASAFLAANGCAGSSDAPLRPSSEARPDGAASSSSPSREEPVLQRGNDGSLPEKIVEFHILPGTGRRGWNDPSTPVIVRAGGTIRIINHDATAAHGLHTDDRRPC